MSVRSAGAKIWCFDFQVCKSTKDCTESSGTPVPTDGTWVLQDQLGDRNTPGPGWFANILPHMMINANAVYAAVFNAEPLFIFGECSLCLRLATGPYLGISSPCPLYPYANLAHLGAAINPNNCKAYRFQEITCLQRVK